MYIKMLEYHDQDTKWRLAPTEFEPFTLFVGVSGVGKSKILQAILHLRSVALGHTSMMGGVSFRVRFQAEMGEYVWRCRFSPMGITDLKSRYLQQFYPMMRGGGMQVAPIIEEETLEKDGVLIFSRRRGACRYREREMPCIDSRLSVVYLFTGEPEIADVRRGLLGVFMMQLDTDTDQLVDNALVQSMRRNPHVLEEQNIITSDLPVITKLAYYSVCRPDKFEEVRRKFMDVFPHVEDLCFREAYQGRFYVLCMKEYNTDYITQGNFSSGMFKTLMFIAQLTMLEGSCVVLIDEIENSLGLNCIDILTDELASTQCDDQFFVTSHHPYIINNIPMENWRVVVRRGNTVSVRTAEQLKLGHSAHDGYMQLINSSQYSGGIE